MVFLVVFSPQNKPFCPMLAVFHNNEAGLATYFLWFEKFNGFLHPSSLANFCKILAITSQTEQSY